MLLRDLLDHNIHVQLSSGIARIDHHRLRAVPLGREPAFYLERHDPSPWQLWIKRAIDIALVVLCAPFALVAVAVAAIAIKLDSRGPIIYRQERIGRGGRPFSMYKLRTMVATAEQQLDERGAAERAHRWPAVQARPRPAGHSRRAPPPGDEHR